VKRFARAVKAKLLRLESYNRELENMDVFKSNGSPGPEEVESSNKSKRTSVVMVDRKDASKLRDVSGNYVIANCWVILFFYY